MATIIDKPNNVKINKTNSDFKADVDSIDVSSVDFSNPSEVKLLVTKMMTLITNLKEMIDWNHKND